MAFDMKCSSEMICSQWHAPLWYRADGGECKGKGFCGESGSLRAVGYERVGLEQRQQQIPYGNDRKKGKGNNKSKDLLGPGHTFPLMTMELS